MDCQRVREEILDACDIEGARPGAAVDSHLSGCAACQQFAERQRALHVRLAAALVTPPMTAAFREDLRSRIRRETLSPWADRLPDIVHFTSCGIATVVSALVLPINPATTVGVGITASFFAYMVLTTVRMSFEDID